MKKTIMVSHTFLNKKGEIKKVIFWMDRQTYEMSLRLSDEKREEFLLNEYREYCKEQKYKRRIINISKLETKMNKDNKSDEEKDKFFILDDYDLYEDETVKMFVEKLASHLNDEEHKIYYMHFYLEKSNVEIAKELGVSEGTIRYKLKKIVEKLKKFG